MKWFFRAKTLYSFEGTKNVTCNKVSGGNDGEDTPVPIPNTEVKLSSADDTWVVTPWESRSLPDLYESLMVICHKAFYYEKSGRA